MARIYEIPDDANWVQCKGQTCDAVVCWVEVAYKNPEKRTDGKTHYKSPINEDGTSHWGTCPDAGSFRKGKRS